MKTLNEVVSELKKLSLIELRSEMAASGVKGKCGDPYLCIMAAYLVQETGLPEVRVMPLSGFYGSGEYVNGTPPVMQEFICNFDNGYYPELEVS